MYPARDSKALWEGGENMLKSIISQIFSFVGRILELTISALLKFINRFIPWHKLPAWIGVLNLWVLRNDLRQYNLHDTSRIDRDTSTEGAEKRPWHPRYRYTRTADGTFNDLSDPQMGSAGTRFGRNVPLNDAWPDKKPELLLPNPREVSLRLMTRDTFKPAETLNILAAAWIQFQAHDWFNHVRSGKRELEIPLADDDEWVDEKNEKKMLIEHTAPDSTRSLGPSSSPPTFINDETHWWDASQIYGSTLEKQKHVRAFVDGKLKIENGRLPEEPDPTLKGIDLTGFIDNWWVGSSLLHTLFVLEHNAICDRLRAEYPTWDDERLFATAHLINAALIAKIHTVEWTPGILGHPALQTGMHANWWGLVTERITKNFGRISDSETISGIPGSPTDHHTAPYYLTEEFVSVYRLHPLIPDDFEFRSVSDDTLLGKMTFTEIQGSHTRSVVDEISMPNLFYSFGIAHPGAITLHNYPRALQRFQRIDGHTFDLAAVDIMRDRERGVPRYNEFRELLRKPRVTSFEQLTDNPQWAQEIKEVYKGDIDRVDLMVGLFAEPPPKGFGFSDTAFRIFILMASRRLKSDRFFTTDYTHEVYTRVGLDWINENGMKSVLMRHFPAVTPAIQNVKNPFAPWTRVTNSQPVHA
jgi:Animal haem peroxidase